MKNQGVKKRYAKYSDDLATEFCARVEMGQPLRAICQTDGMPSLQCVFNWFQKYPVFLDLYAHAKAAQAEILADEIVTIADEEPDANRARVRVDARKWVAAHLLPKRYGDRIIQDINANAKVSVYESLPADARQMLEQVLALAIQSRHPQGLITDESK